MRATSNTFRVIIQGIMLAFVLIALCAPRASAQQAATPLSADEVSAVATDAYVFGYPLVTMEYTRRVLTNVAEAGAMKAPMGQLARARAYPTASFRDVTAPNARYSLYQRVDRRE